jgi:hypothetical protein
MKNYCVSNGIFREITYQTMTSIYGETVLFNMNRPVKVMEAVFERVTENFNRKKTLLILVVKPTA